MEWTEQFILFLLGTIIISGIVRWLLSMQEENRRAREAILSLETHCEEAREEINKVRKYRHDMPKHIRLVEAAACRNDADFSYCRDRLLDTILVLTGEKCKDKEIPFFVELPQIKENFSNGISLEKQEFAALIHNLLDNAMEENLRIREKEHRKICFTLSQKKDGTQIEVINACADEAPLDFVTKKQDSSSHGFGVPIIRDVVRVGNGAFHYEKQGTTLRTWIFLPENGMKNPEKGAGR